MEHFNTFRSGGKKGGGIQIIMPESEGIKFKKIENESTEILDLEGEIYGMGIKIILVYFDANKNKVGNEANRKIRKDVETLIEKMRKRV